MLWRSSRVVFAAVMVAVAPAVLAQSDSILSRHVKEADGTTGQDTNSGSGIKAGHLQNGAVATAKIADAAVTEGKLADGAVKAAKLGITCPDGFYLQFTMFGGWTCSIGTPGPVGPQGLQGDPGAMGPQGPPGAAPRYEGVVVVAKSGGDFADPVAAIASITDASASKPYLVKIMPGRYVITSTLPAVPWIDIEGSGRGVTTIATAPGSLLWNAASLAGFMEIRDLSIESDSAFAGIQGGDGSIRNVSVSVSGNGAVNGAIVGIHLSSRPLARIDGLSVTVRPSGNAGGHGVYTALGTTRLKDATIDVSGGNTYGCGLFIEGDTLADANDVRVQVSGLPTSYGVSGAGGILLRNGSVTVQGASTAYGLFPGGGDVANSTISVSGGGGIAVKGVGQTTVLIANTKVQGLILPSGYTNSGYKCFGVYDANFAPVVCP